MTKLYIPIGILGSGKSTWAAKMVAENPNVKIVCPDAIRAMLNGTYQYMEGLDIVITNICQEAIRQLVRENWDIIVDCCNLGGKRRRDWLEASYVKTTHRELDHNVPMMTLKKVYQTVAVIFPNRDKSWHIRNVMKTAKGRLFSRDYWEKVYARHIKHFEAIDKDFFNEIIYVE